MLREPTWDIDVDDDGHTLAVRPSGELDLSTSPELISAFVKANGQRQLVCDLSGITFIDSSGIRALIEIGQREPKRFALAGASEPVERLLELTGVAGWFRRAPVS
ncbi:MAG TPA: STAS domain-containing protein [Solirubrobacteraceae bacterium]|jgi:anti-anti-sigma factor|nr:STAS domain-containing protein [Solirubrobacteraceae bacterium]